MPDEPPLSDLERDLAIIASRNVPDPFLELLAGNAERIGGAAIGLLTNGMIVFGLIASPREIAAQMDAYHGRIAAIAGDPEGVAEDEWREARERFIRQNRDLVEKTLAEREAFEEELLAHLDQPELPASLDRRRIGWAARVFLNLRDVSIVAPGEADPTKVPVMRVRVDQVSGWWLVPPDDQGRAVTSVWNDTD